MTRLLNHYNHPKSRNFTPLVTIIIYVENPNNPWDIIKKLESPNKSFLSAVTRVASEVIVNPGFLGSILSNFYNHYTTKISSYTRKISSYYRRFGQRKSSLINYSDDYIHPIPIWLITIHWPTSILDVLTNFP